MSSIMSVIHSLNSNYNNLKDISWTHLLTKSYLIMEILTLTRINSNYWMWFIFYILIKHEELNSIICIDFISTEKGCQDDEEDFILFMWSV